MSATPEKIEAGAQALAALGEHWDENNYHCQWPEQSPEHISNNRTGKIAHGCRGCLIGAAAASVVSDLRLLVVGVGTFSNDDANAVLRRAIELAPRQQELMPRQTAEVVEA